MKERQHETITESVYLSFALAQLDFVEAGLLGEVEAQKANQRDRDE